MNKRFLIVCQIILAVVLFACDNNMSTEVSYIPYKAEKDSKWGLIDFAGKPLIIDEFSEQPSFVTENRFYVKNSDGLYEFYTAEKKFKKIGKEYVHVGSFHNGLAPAVEPNKSVSYINHDGTIAFDLSSYKGETIVAASEFSDGMACFKTESGKFGYINTAGEVTIEPIYSLVSGFYDGLAWVYKAQNESYGESFLIDKKGKIVFKVNPDYTILYIANKNEIVYAEKIDEQDACGILNGKGEPILKASKKYDFIFPADKKHFVYVHNGEYGLVDIKGNVKIRAKYSELLPMRNLLLYSANDKKGLLSYEGDKIGDELYENILPFPNNSKYTYALDNKEWIVIDRKGKEVNKGSFYDIRYDYMLDRNLNLISISSLLNTLLIESDYVDIQAEVDAFMRLLNNDGSVDKLTYNTTPEDFARIYNIDYKVSDLKDEKTMTVAKDKERFVHPYIRAVYNETVIVPQYEREWKESYWGTGYWQKVISGYKYNPFAVIDKFILYIELKGKLKERKQEVFNALTFWMETRGFTKLSENESESIYWEKNTPVTLFVGTHLKDGSLSIAVERK